MPRRLLKPENVDRFIGVTFGAWFIYFGWWLWIAWADEHSGVAPVFYDWLWPWVFAFAGVLGFAYALRPASTTLTAFSGGAMILAVLSRSASLLVTWLADRGPLSTPRAMLGGGVWAFIAYLLGLIWVRLLIPIGSRRRER